MRQEIRSKDCSLTGSSDLTVIAPIRKGFVPSLDAVTYKTRVQRVLRALHTGRSSLHEFELARMLSDAVERVGRIHSVRIAVLEDQDAVLLAVTFDGAWESYVRVIWQKVARLLDLIFCNTEGYVNGWESSFEDWGKWLRHRQAETSFLYAIPALSTDDTVYLRMQERLSRADHASELGMTRVASPTAEEIAEKLFFEGRDLTTLPSGRRLHDKLEAQPAVFRQGLRSLAGLYRLADLYPPNTPDGIVLLRATHELLPEFARVASGGDQLALAWKRAQERFKEPLAWFTQTLTPPPPRTLSPPPGTPRLPDAVQGGILEPYPDVDDAVVLLVHFDSSAAVEALIAAATVTLHVDQHSLKAGELTYNLAFTAEGLRAAGLTDEEIESFPTEFVQGMEKRAGLLGDLRANHPRRWRLPVKNWAAGTAAADVPDAEAGERIPLKFVHAVIHLRRIRVLPVPQPSDGRQALLDTLKNLLDKSPGVRPLSLQWLHRMYAQTHKGEKIVDHFGFQDSDSDPKFSSAHAGGVYPNHVQLGEALLGHPNAGDAAAPQWPAASDWTRTLIQNASFLVVRKLRLDLGVLEEVLVQGQKDTPLARDELLAKMMGRWPHGSALAGEPLVERPPAPRNSNDFGYDDDRDGRQCPLHAHIRRANPRDVPDPAEVIGSRPPRLFRRGMSYGAPYVAQNPDSLQEERGVFFMAYNASLGEQFEVVQRWVSGGNSAKGYSGQGDPLLAVAEPGRPGGFRFEHSTTTERMKLDGNDDLLAEPRPMVRLEWGGYFFAPSFDGIKLLARRAECAKSLAATEPLTWSVERGKLAVDTLLRMEKEEGAQVAAREWKTALEDPESAADFTTASIWAALRAEHGGVLRTPYGVLIATRTGVEEVLRNQTEFLTSTAYLPRMAQSFGINYLGMDPGQDDERYETESKVCNEAIRAIADTPAAYDEVFDTARATVAAKIGHFVEKARTWAREDEQLRLAAGLEPRRRLQWEVSIEIRELIDDLLASFCERWFGLDPDSPLMERSGFRWTWQPGEPPPYPGHFMAPSRYIFQPHPEPEVEETGTTHGRGMRQAMVDLLQTPGKGTLAPVSKAVLTAYPEPKDRPFVARVLVGAMMGMVPTIDANLRRVLDRWLVEGTLWGLRTQLEGAQSGPFRSEIRNAFQRTMQSRVAPDTLWRTVQRGCPMKRTHGEPVQLRPGDIVVAGLGSVAHQDMEQGLGPEVSVAFGDTSIAPHPAHACPGYQPALAMMEGFAAALVDFPLSPQPGPGPLTVVFSGFDAGLKGPPLAQGCGPVAPRLRSLRHTKSLSVVTREVWTYGDSWLSLFGVLGRSSLAEEFEELGFEVDAALSAPGAKLSEMAANVSAIKYKLLKAKPGKVHALLVGGGGNDVTNSRMPHQSVLFDLLVGPATKPLDSLNGLKVDEFVDKQCKTHLEKVLKELKEGSAHLAIPILTHSYANPIADGRGPTIDDIPVGDAWLEPVFLLKGMRDRSFNSAVMAILIGRLNAMARNVVRDLNDPRVQYVDLRGYLNENWSQSHPTKHHADWMDELHPTPSGFATLAAQLAQRVPALVTAQPLLAKYIPATPYSTGK